jgi:hypothetical protein
MNILRILDIILLPISLYCAFDLGRSYERRRRR